MVPPLSLNFAELSFQGSKPFIVMMELSTCMCVFDVVVHGFLRERAMLVDYLTIPTFL